MTLEQYIQLKKERLLSEKKFRVVCLRCNKPEATCYCLKVDAFDSNPEFVILMHRDEARRSVATGRMAHLCLSNSKLIVGTNFTHNEKVNALIQSPTHHSVLLYPGQNAVNLTHLTLPERKLLVPPNKKIRVFVIDSTWGQAKRMKRLSRNLHLLPQYCFTPQKLSGFSVRTQPKPECYSTIEAIHHLIELFGTNELQKTENLLEVFTYMVNQQVAYRAKYEGPFPHRGIREAKKPVFPTAN